MLISYYKLKNFINNEKRTETVRKGNGELLELRLLETGFLSRFQLNP